MRLGCERDGGGPEPGRVVRCSAARLITPSGLPGRSGRCRISSRIGPTFVEDYQAGKVKKRKGSDRPHFNDDGSIPSTIPRSRFRRGKAGWHDCSGRADLAWQVRAWGRWVLERSRQDFGDALSHAETASRQWLTCGRARRAIAKTPGASAIEDFLAAPPKRGSVSLCCPCRMQMARA